MLNYARAALHIAGAVVVAMGLYVVATFVDIVVAGSRDNGKFAEVIVVMGAAQYDGVPSPLLESRLSTALDLWKRNRAPLIAVTGGKREGDRFTESEAGQNWLEERGVPTSAIVKESVGESTWQSLEKLAPILEGAGVSNAIVVSSDWHVGRAGSTLEELGVDVVSTASPSIGDGWNVREWCRETMGVSLGRLLGFGVLFSITG